MGCSHNEMLTEAQTLSRILAGNDTKDNSGSIE